jgi:hypothetical protein
MRKPPIYRHCKLDARKIDQTLRQGPRPVELVKATHQGNKTTDTLRALSSGKAGARRFERKKKQKKQNHRHCERRARKIGQTLRQGPRPVEFLEAQ